MALAALLGLALALAIARRFVLDDAFISFHYARNLVEGHGLTWFGTRIEGYTNFLWVLWIALGLRLGADPVAWAHAGSIAAFLAAVCGLWRLGGRVFGTRLPVVTAVLLFIANATVASFATSGLETMLQTACLCLAASVVYDMWARRAAGAGQCLALSALGTLAILTRMDSIVLLAVLGVTLFAVLPRSSLSAGRMALLVVPAAVTAGAWLIWKQGYYHRLLPNSFYVKVGVDPQAWLSGLRYVARFWSAYWLWPFLALGAVFHAGRRLAIPPRLVPLLALVGAWSLYAVAVGGDFMEFRFLVPATPFLFLLIAYCIHDVLGVALLRRPAGAVLLSGAVLIAASVWHAAAFRGQTRDHTLDSIPALASFYGRYPETNWDRIGRPLGAEIGDLDAVIALHAVGAIPYFSRLRTVDMLGLNDPNIAARGLVAPDSMMRPGHRRHFPLQYLRERGVNLVIGHPMLVPRGPLGSPELASEVSAWWSACAGVDPEPVRRILVVAVPVDDRAALLALYLTRTPELDRRIQARGWAWGIFRVGS